MKRFLYSFVLLLGAASTVGAQVHNGGFELCSSLPTTTGEWELVDGWNNAGSVIASPDYFHENGALGGDLPETPIAIVNAYEGEAVMGFTATGHKGSNFREYISAALSSPLVPGEKYVVTFYVSNGNVTDFSSSGLGTSHLGVAFTTISPVQIGNNPLMLDPQFRKQTVVFNREWEEISFSFTADQAYTVITIGVFGDDTDKTIEVFDGSNPQLAYYFVDDVKMSVVPQESQEANEGAKGDENQNISEVLEEEGPNFFIPNAFTPNGDGDNDFFAPVVPEFSNYRFCIFNRWGEVVFETTSVENAWDGRTQGGRVAESDMYVWELSYTVIRENGDRVNEHHQGTVNLLR